MRLNKLFVIVSAGLILATIAVSASVNSGGRQDTVSSSQPTSQVVERYADELQRASNIQTSVESSSDAIKMVQYTDGGCPGGCDSGCQACGMDHTGFDIGPHQQGFQPSVACSDCGGAMISGGQKSCKKCLTGRRPPELSHAGQQQVCQAPGPVRSILGVNEYVGRSLGREPTFRDSQLVPWEMFSYGEYIGPHRTPHVPEYRLRVDDQLEFVFYLTRRQSATPYRVFVGDVIRISSATDADINQREITVLSDGMVSLPLIGQVRAAQKSVSDLQDELNELYSKFLTDPAILVQVVEGDTPLNDILDSVDARGGVGGRLRQATVSPDGTIQLPAVGSVPAVGLTLDEIRREINARYREQVPGLEVTPVLVQRAPRFIYVVGQVTTPGRFELLGPTTALQALALAESDLQGGNLRNIIVLRRDEAWRLTATRLDLSGTLFGTRPFPSDEIFLRDSDIIVVPRKPIQRLSEAVDLYLTSTLYSIFPEQLIFDLDGFGGVGQ